MKIYRYTIKLKDFLFYSREGLSGAIPPSYLHATAINGAIASVLNSNPQKQPYITIDSTVTKRNNPIYENSILSSVFYFTPAKPVGDIKLVPEYVKGEQDGYAVYGYGGTVKTVKDSIENPNGNTEFEFKQGGYEILKYSKLFFITPDTEFTGFCWCQDDIQLPVLIRLGSFRSPAKVSYSELRFRKITDNEIASHPVDPLVSTVKRGVAVTIFPYPVIDDALCEVLWKVSDYSGKQYLIAPVDGNENIFEIIKGERIRSNQESVIL
ncbi:MAG: type I-D CRISPR-associated protein Cas5/Csc1 [bacterium]